MSFLSAARRVRNLGVRLALLLTVLAWPQPAAAVEYCGENIDGRFFDAYAHSHGTGLDYHVLVEFRDFTATLYHPQGTLQLRLLYEEIEDPDDIPAYDEDDRIAWRLTLPDLECED